MKRCAGALWSLLLLLSLGVALAGGPALAAGNKPVPPEREATGEPAPAAGEKAAPAHETPPSHEGGDETAGAAARGEATHEAGHAGDSDATRAFHVAESSSFYDLILKQMGYRKPAEEGPDENSPTLQRLAMFQIPVLSVVVSLILVAVFVTGARRRAMIPGKLQNLVEMAIGSFDEFVQGILGLEGRAFLPFLGTLFLYIWVSNLIGLLPFMKSPTSSINTTIALALCVFLYVQYTGIRRNGIGGYLYHLAGEPKDPIGWGLVPLMLPLHVIGELAKPMSLSLRLFGNIFGEETLIAVMVGLGVGALAFLHVPLGIPFQVPFMLLSLLFSTIQALVFTLLATIYFSLMLPHHEHHHDEKHAAGAPHH